MIEIRHLRKAFEASEPLKDVSVDIFDGDVIAVIGPSGTGKSTLLRCMNLLERPTSGQILLNGQDITAKGCDVPFVRRKMGMVFQTFNLFNHLTVVENVMYAPVKLLGLSRRQAYDRAVELLRAVGMDGRLMNRPEQMSGGQKQRVAIARALAMDPEIILFDEPTSALDPTMTAEVQAVIRELARRKKTMVIVTHEMRFAREISNRVLYLDEGMIYEEGTPEEIFEHPKREKTRRFIRSLRVLEVDILPDLMSFAETLARINGYFSRNRIPPEICIRLQSAIEELCMQILAPEPGITDMRLTLEYTPSSEKAEMTVEYPGAFRPEDTANTLAYSILQARSESIAYEADPDRARSIVRVRIR